MRLGEKVQLLGEDRQLAGLRALQLAVDADHVAQVEALGQRPVVLADLAAADEELNLAGPIADVDEDQLALLALQHDPAGGPHLGTVLRRLALLRARRDRLDRDLALAAANLADRHLAVEPAAPGVDAQLLDLAQLLAARGFVHAGVDSLEELILAVRSGRAGRSRP